MEAIKRTLLFVLALATPVISLQLFPVEAEALMDALRKSVGPTMPFLVIFSFYSLAGLLIASQQKTDDRKALDILSHTQAIASLIIALGMLGTYYALIQVFSSGNADFSAHMNALYSTLIALITYIVVLCGAEFVKRLKITAVETAKAESLSKTASSHSMTIQQIEMAGLLMGVCLFVYLALASANVQLFQP